MPFPAPLRQKLLMLPPYLLGGLYAVLASYGVFVGGVWAGGVIGVTLLTALLVGFGQSRWILPSRIALFFVFFGVVAAVLSSFDAVNQDKAWHETIKVLSIFLPLSFLSSSSLRPYWRWSQSRLKQWFLLLSCSVLVMSVVLAFIYNLWGYDERLATNFNRGFSYNLLLFFPFMAAFSVHKQNRKMIFIVGSILFLSLCLTHSRASQLGVLVAAGVFWGAKFWPTFFRWGLVLGTVVCFVLPWGMSSAYSNYVSFINKMPLSWQHRMEIWDALSYHLSTAPFFGQGVGNTKFLDVIGPHTELYRQMPAMAAHPHNAAVQLWVELGVVGATFGLFTCFWALWGVGRLSKRVQPYGYAAYAFALVLAMIAYNLWTDSLWSAYALTAFSFSALVLEKDEN